jgi:hypothetical protein
VAKSSRVRRLLAALALLAGVLTVSAHAAVVPSDQLYAGAATVDATWHVGASAGQYASTASVQDEWDPSVQSVKNASAYGVASRLSVRAIVLRNPGGYPVALVKDDNYLSQDTLVRRAAAILAERGSSVTYDHLLVSATHDHSSPYYATPAAGVWLFQDVMDLRMLEYQARAIATAVQTAERRLRPARMGAVTVPFSTFQGNIAGAGIGEDGAPVGYPLQENDHGVTVLRIDGTDGRPIATYANYAEHGESLDGYDLISGDWVAPFQRYVDRATGAPVVFSQGSVGSAEGPYEHAYPKGKAPLTPDGVPAVWAHMGYAQAERGAHLLAEAVVGAWRSARVSTHAEVAMLTHWVPGPVSHPYPSVSNCRTGPAVDGDPGAPVVGLPDCERASDAFGQSLPAAGLDDALRATGLPVPANYDAPSLGAVEENARLKLQAVRIGPVLLASCACEPQSDVVKALETRTDTLQGNRWDGFDVASQADVTAAWPGRSVRACVRVATGFSCPDPRDDTGTARTVVPPAAFARMEAEIRNPADGWDDPSYAAEAGAEPVDPHDIKGNFTSKELPSRCGFDVTVGLGHTGDYNGYTVSYREYMSRDAYRKALTSYGPHTADYMVTRLMAMASALSCGTPLPAEPLDAAAAADEVRQQAEADALGELSSYYLDTWDAQLPSSLGPAAAVAQPRSLQRFGAATFSWVGGDNFTDGPAVTVQRRVGSRWVPYADQSGEVQVVLDQPGGIASSLVANRAGRQRWTWTASFEAYDAFPRTTLPGGQVPSGTYRFAVAGRLEAEGAQRPYSLVSQAFSVSRFTGLTGEVVRSGSTVRFLPAAYPRTYASPIRFVADDKGGLPGAASVLCKTCTFRPWATRPVMSRVVWTTSSGRHPVGRSVTLEPGETAWIAPGGLTDGYGETNAQRIS